MTGSARSYVVASTPRSGSSLLCEALERTGIAGRPAEVFAPDFRGTWFARWHVSENAPFSEYFAAARRYGTGRNGVYGVKIQYMHVPVLAAWASATVDDVLDRLFPDAAFVNLKRRDRRAQALSWFRAIRTDNWFQTRTGRIAPAPELDRGAVLELESHLAWQQSAWERFFVRKGIQPLTVEYESLAMDYRGVTANLLAFLGLSPGVAALIPEPLLVRQADEVTLQWRQTMDSAICSHSRADSRLG